MIRSALIALIALMLSGTPAVATEYFGDDNGAANGTDVVAYFTQGQAVTGSAEFEFEWEGSTWRFANEEHLNQFVADPERYAPRFGGAGTLTVAHGGRYPGNPAAWSIYNNRLYFFLFPAARETWLMNSDKLIPRAEEQWQKMSSER
jgi:YHS domain-containing protein